MDLHFKLKEWFLAMGFHKEDLPPDWKFKDMCRGKYAMVFENVVRLVKPKHEVDTIKKLLFVHDMKEVILNEKAEKKRTAVHEPSSYTLWKERKVLQDKLSVLQQDVKSKEKHILSSNESLKAKAVSRLELKHEIKNDHRKSELLKYKTTELHHDLQLLEEMCNKAPVCILQRSSLDEKKSTVGHRKNRNPEEIVNSCLAKVNEVWKVKFHQEQENHKDISVRHNDTMLSGNTSSLSSTKCFADRNDYSTQIFPTVEFEAKDKFESEQKFLNNYLDTNMSGLSGKDIWTSLTEHQEFLVKTLAQQATAIEVQENEDIYSSLPREMLSCAYLTHSDLVLQTLHYKERCDQATKQILKHFEEYLGESCNTLQELFTLRVEQTELEATIQVFKEEQEDLASRIVSHTLPKQIEAVTSEIMNYDKLCLTKKSEIEQAVAALRAFSPKLKFIHKRVNDFLDSLNGSVSKAKPRKPLAAPNIKVQVNNITVSSQNVLEASQTYEDFVNDLAGIGNGTAVNHAVHDHHHPVQLLLLRHYFADKTQELARIQAKTLDTSFTRELGVDSSLETTGDVADMPIVNLADELKYFDRCFPFDKNRKLCLPSGRAIWISESLLNSLQQIAHDVILEGSLFNPLLSPNSFLMQTQVRIALLTNMKEVFENAYVEEEDMEKMDISPLVARYDQRVDTMKKKLSEVDSWLKKISRQLESSEGSLQFWSSGKIRSFVDPSRTVARKTLHEYQTQYDAILSGRYGSAFKHSS